MRKLSRPTPLQGALVFLLLTSILGGGSVFHLQRALTATEATLATTQQTLESTEKTLETTSVTLREKEELLLTIQNALSLSEENGAELLSLLTSEKERNDSFEEQIHSMSETVDVLDTLAKTDEELLKKYSKVFFLNEHYMPGLVEKIPEEFRATPSEDEFIHKKVFPHLTSLLRDAQKEDIMLTIVSAYRSFDEQKSLKSSYSITYGSGANAFSADQGFSEHQLGTTIDFSTPKLAGSLTGFEKTDAYVWLTAHAHEYGFVLSYPKDNAYYIFEPWHWRYVGTKLATDLHENKKFFYDLDQREIDEYLISLFN